MRVCVGVLTFEPIRTGRWDMLRETWRTIREHGHDPAQTLFFLQDGGSKDGSWSMLRDMGAWPMPSMQATVGQSMNVIVTRALQADPDLIVFSADDYAYRPGWLATLLRLYDGLPPTVMMVSQNVEPIYAWNAVYATGKNNDVPFVMRESVPGSAWTFRAKDWPRIGPVADKTGGEDLEICRRLRESGLHLAAVNLTDHIGERQSAWGNRSWTLAQPAPLQEWGLA